MANTVLRFAPSPTGGFHVGNARTALYNYLYAKHYGAKLLLRVEDTDAERSTGDSLETILQGLEWLGITFDAPPVFQSQNAAAHREDAERLVASGAAYCCAASPAEIDAIRAEAQKAGRGARFPKAGPEEVRALAARGERPVVYFRVPDGDTVWDDAIRGLTRWDNAAIGDFVILRSDGTPVYNLAVVVDDHEMGVDFVLRAADHISNTPKQIMLFAALGWDVPRYAHTTLLLGEDGSKLSKRHGSTTVTDYREQGFLPEAVVNFLALLGWSPGDSREVFAPDELVAGFSIERMLKKDSVFDEKKLLWLNGEHIRRKAVDELLPAAIAEWQAAGLIGAAGAGAGKDVLRRIVALMQPRVERLGDFRNAAYFFRDPEAYDDEALRKNWKSDTPARVAAFVDRLRAAEPFTEAVVEGATRTLAGEMGLSASRLIHPTRLLLCGVGYGPGLFELMEVLGKETCLRRLEAGLEALAAKEPADRPA